MSPSFAPLIAIADRFSHPGQVTDLKPFGNGNINDTFLVTVDVPVDHQFVLQRINTQVFHHPQWVMDNMRIVTEHIHQQLQETPLDRRWETPRVLLTRDREDHIEDESGSFWRAISFIDESAALEQIQDVDHAREVGFALGTFHRLIQGIPASSLNDTLEGFHNTPRYVEHYKKVLETSKAVRSVALNRCLRWVRDRMSIGSTLENAKLRGELPLRIMHGDPKVNNVMIDIATQKAISIVDLDTVKPGLLHYDIGDCLRSGCNPLGEEVEDASLVTFDLALCAGILQGYLPEMRSVFADAEYDYIFDAVRVITFELGLRFLTDHLAGNVYFKVKDGDHNLRRAIVQFRLMESLEGQEDAVRKMVEGFR
jgi:Phosphotransferase enzyme family